VATTDIARPTARLSLPGSGTTPAEIEVVYQPRATRVTRAVLIGVLALLVAPVVFFIPPHFLWPLAVLLVAGFMARRTLVSEYHVTSFQGACPRCGTDIEIEPGTRIGARHTLECYSCHRQPQLVVDDPDENDRDD
jgi:hypothetical protein